jgi:uncharacterized protein YjbI with pentapeptide repeats
VSEELPPVRCDDASTWRHNGEKIDLPRLLQLIEENDSPMGLDLHGCHMDGVDARPEALRPHLETYSQKHDADAEPPWLSESGTISLRGAHLENATLTYAHLENADLVAAFLQGATLKYAHFDGAELVGAQLQKADLRYAHLENAMLPFAKLQSAVLAHADLKQARLWSADFHNAKLLFADLQDTNLWEAHLEDADLRYAQLRAVIWHAAHLDRTRLRRDELGPTIGDELAAKGRHRTLGTLRDAREAYMALKTNFDSFGRYEDASWAYVKEQQMEKAMYFPTTEGHMWLMKRMGAALPAPCWGPRRLPSWLWWKLRSGFYHARLFLGVCPHQLKEEMARRDEQGEERDEWLSRWRWARNWAYELLTGYGERPLRPVIWAAVVIAVFTGVYAGAGNIASGDGGASHNFLTALTHSIATFATVGFNTLEPDGWGARLLTAIEAMFGIGLFALFVFTLGNRMRRS